MGSKLAILAAHLIVVGVAGIAHAETAAELFKKGVEHYKAGKYEAAATALEKAYAIEPKPDILFALAQAERLAGQCDRAIPHYKKLLEQTTEISTAKAVQFNLELCPQAAPPPEPPAPEPEPVKVQPPPPPPPPKTIVREVRHTDGLGVALTAIGALGGGVAIGMALRSTSTRDDAASAGTLDDSNRLHDRADRDRLIAIIAGGASAVAIGFGIYRLSRGGGEQTTTTTDVALVPTGTGSMMVLTRSW